MSYPICISIGIYFVKWQLCAMTNLIITIAPQPLFWTPCFLIAMPCLLTNVAPKAPLDTGVPLLPSNLNVVGLTNVFCMVYKFCMDP